MKDKKISGKSTNHQEELLNLLKKQAPEVFSEGNVDCKKLKQTLGEEVELGDERYGMNWASKSDCFREIQQPTTATLKPDRKESVDFDKTENLFIEGENLEVLKVLQKSYYGEVKMIYIDPPYNTGNDFIYKDNFKQKRQEYEKENGIKDKNGDLRSDGLMKNTRDRGHYHSDWMSMMYPRLFLARNILRQDGVISVSIDDNEVHNLRMIMNEIFGEENFVAQFVWNGKSGSEDDSHIRNNKEYIICFARSINLFTVGLDIKSEEKFIHFDKVKNEYYKRQLLRKWGDNSKRKDRPNLYYPIKDNNNDDFYPKLPNGEEGCWRWSKQKMQKEIDLGIVEFSENGRLEAYEKIYKSDVSKMTKKFQALLLDDGNTAGGTKEIKNIFNNKLFDRPKPSKLIVSLLKIANTKKNDIALDFFAGSGTTAHAVMVLNAEDGGNRKCISVQLPEETDEKSEAYKAGYKNIAEIARERIRRAGKKIKSESKKKIDIGFKAFKLDQSNFKIWRKDIKDEKELMKQMNMFVDNVKTKSTQENILYELILKSGLDLNVDVVKKEVGKKVYYIIDEGKLIICLEDKISKGVVDAILAEKPEKVICLDRAFGGNDQLKTNAHLQMESAKVDFKVI